MTLPAKVPARAKLQRGDPVWYRLLVRVPFVVAFDRSAWRFEEPHLASGRAEHWELEATCMNGGGRWILSEWFMQLDWLEQALYQDGFASRHLTAAETIIERAVKLGHAEKLLAVPPNVGHGRGRPWMW